MQIFIKQSDGTEHDITEGVQALYDLLLHSMDWGSGFLTAEDAVPVYRLAKLCGFKGLEEAEKYIRFLRKEMIKKAHYRLQARFANDEDREQARAFLADPAEALKAAGIGYDLLPKDETESQ